MATRSGPVGHDPRVEDKGSSGRVSGQDPLADKSVETRIAEETGKISLSVMNWGRTEFASLRSLPVVSLLPERNLA